jgi:hypothetical protein
LFPWLSWRKSFRQRRTGASGRRARRARRVHAARPMWRRVPVLVALRLVLVLVLILALVLVLLPPPPPFSSPVFRFGDSPLLPPWAPRPALPDSTSGTLGSAAERPLNHQPPPPPSSPPSPPSRFPLSPLPSPLSTSYARAMAARVDCPCRRRPPRRNRVRCWRLVPPRCSTKRFGRSPCTERGRWERWGEEAEEGEKWSRVADSLIRASGISLGGSGVGIFQLRHLKGVRSFPTYSS